MSHNPSWFKVASAAALLAVAACGSTKGAGDGGADAGPTGSLVIQVAAPDSGTPSIAVTGPGYSQTVHGSTTLFVPPGDYSVASPLLVTPDSIAGQAYWPTVSLNPATVIESYVTQVQVDYALDGASGMLWYPYWVNAAPFNGGIQGIPVASLKGANLVNSVVIGLGDGGYGEAVAFDPAGTLWTLDNGHNTVASWSVFMDGGVQNLRTINITEPGATNFINLSSMAFGPNGDLWVVDENNASMIRYAAGQLTTSGTPTPANVIHSPLVSGHDALAYATDLAFDSSGNLWVATLGGTFAEFINAGTAGIQTTPTLLAQANATCGITGISFDPAGNLWAAVGKCDKVVQMFQRPTGTGYITVSPAASLRDLDGGAPFLDEVQNLTFDQSGSLWTRSNAPYHLSRVDSPAAFTGTVQPTPSIDITFGLQYVGTARMQFDAPNPGLGLYP